jgi:hypothetical protein
LVANIVAPGAASRGRLGCPVRLVKVGRGGNLDTVTHSTIPQNNRVFAQLIFDLHEGATAVFGYER